MAAVLAAAALCPMAAPDRLWGEERTVVLNLRELLLKSFPVSNPAWGNDAALNNLIFTGSNFGTEQYGPARVALDLRRLAILTAAP